MTAIVQPRGERLAEMNAMLEVLGETWRRLPSLRLGQVIGNAIAPSYHGDPFYVPDAEMAQSLRIFGEANV